VEERDGLFIIYQLRRGFLGFTRYKKLAQARCRESALRIIHILIGEEILHWEVSAVWDPEYQAF
jgi:hypothetical protein